MAWYDKVLGSLATPVVDYLKVRQETKSKERIRKMELDDAVHVRRMELISKGLAADASWELAQINNSGWKDEYVLFVISVPLVGCFVPGLAPYIREGFSILDTLPNYYKLIVISVFLATYGIRYWRREQSDT